LIGVGILWYNECMLKELAQKLTIIREAREAALAAAREADQQERLGPLYG